MSNPTVTAVGNSWVICRSKSHSGHVYYFNTLTGESVWNLSEVELRKAKARLQNQENRSDMDCYPEPKEPPSQTVAEVPATIKKFQQETQTQAQSPTPTRVYNKQVINNQFAEGTLPLSPFIAPQLITPSVSAFNPNIWAIPPTVLIQTGSPYEAQLQNFNVSYNNQTPNVTVQNTSVPLCKRFVNLDSNKSGSRQNNRKKDFSNFPSNNRTKNFSLNNRNNNKIRNNAVHKAHKPQKLAYNVPSNDLRSLLMSKRNKFTEFNSQKVCFQAQNNTDNIENANKETEFGYEEAEEDRICNPRVVCFDKNLPRLSKESVEKEAQIVRQSKEDCYSDVDSDWLEDNIRVSGSKLQLDISSLISLADPNLNQASWFIAVDMNILLGHLNFMNILLDSDKDCKLMLPRDELTALREQADAAGCKPRDRRRARRAIAFISQRLDANTAIIGEQSSHSGNEDYPYLLDCCINLSDENYFVVLLSNNDDLEEYKSTTDIPIFNIQQLKHFLSNISNDLEQSNPPRPLIVVRNDEARENDESAILKADTESYCESIESADHKSCESDVANTNRDVQSTNTKHTADAVVQTDIISTEMEQSTSDADCVKKFQENSSRNSYDTNTSKSKVEPTRKIRLKRNTAIVTPICNTNDKKQFKWRRKRNVSHTQTSDSHQNSSSSNNEHSCSSQLANGTELNAVPSTDVPFSNVLENSSETNSSIIIHRTSLGKVTIDESSTSVISNTVSNVDSELECDFKYKSMMRDTNPDIEDTDSIVNVNDLNIQSHLESRRDEWISRFVQIMEEVLTEVLQKYNEVSPYILPPPWTIQEATICVKVKFCDEKYVTDAADRFLNILNRVCDSQGRWNQEMRLKEFLEMYRYGIYLVKSLKLKVLNFEDLDIALDLLNKLLNDVSNPGLEASHNENFENTYEDCPNDSSNSTSNQRSRMMGSIYQNDTENVNQTKNVDSGSLSHRYSHTPTCKKCSETSLFGEDEFVSKKEINSNCSNSSINNKVEPKIIRKFTVFPEFEKKIMNDSNNSNFDDSNNSHYDGCYSEEERNVSPSKMSHEEIFPKASSSECQFEIDTNTSLKEDVTEINLTLIYENILDEIKDTLKRVYLFCEHSHHKLRNSKNTSVMETEIQEKAREAFNCIETLIKSLNSMICQDTRYLENSMLSQFSQAGFKVLSADIKQIENYRNKIASMIEQANILHESVNIIISSVTCS